MLYNFTSDEVQVQLALIVSSFISSLHSIEVQYTVHWLMFATAKRIIHIQFFSSIEVPYNYVAVYIYTIIWCKHKVNEFNIWHSG